jgi:hypothetical protein
MNGAHDLGGQMGFGPIDAPATEPVFHENWEARMAALAMTLAGGWTIHAPREISQDELLRALAARHGNLAAKIHAG